MCAAYGREPPVGQRPTPAPTLRCPYRPVDRLRRRRCYGWSGGRPAGQRDSGRMALARLVGPLELDGVARVVGPEEVGQVVRRGDGLPVEAGDHVTLHQAGLGAGRSGQGPFDHGSGGGAPAATAAPPESTGVPAAEACTTAPTDATARVLHADTEESCRPDVDGGRLVTGLNLLGDGEGGADGDGISMGSRDPVAGPGRGRRIHAEDLARGVDQWSTGVAGFDPGIDLDEPGEALGVPTVAVTGGDRLAEGSDRSPGCARGPTGPAGVPDADYRLADGGGIAAGRDRPQTAGVNQLDDGH